MSLTLPDFVRQNRGSPERQRELDIGFWQIIEGAGLRRWRPGDPIRPYGQRLLVGLASYSIYDAELAQELIDHMSSDSPLTVEVFNVEDVSSMGEFQQYVSGIGSVYQTPVVGLWEENKVIRIAQGFEARSLVRELLKNFAPGR
jgi:hypothetical protein